MSYCHYYYLFTYRQPRRQCCSNRHHKPKNKKNCSYTRTQIYQNTYRAHLASRIQGKYISTWDGTATFKLQRSCKQKKMIKDQILKRNKIIGNPQEGFFFCFFLVGPPMIRLSTGNFWDKYSINKSIPDLWVVLFSPMLFFVPNFP